MPAHAPNGRSQHGTDEYRQIEAAAAPTRFARGWHCLGLARSFRDGQPHEVKAFGTTLVVFRSEIDDTLHVLDAYCRHMNWSGSPTRRRAR